MAGIPIRFEYEVNRGEFSFEWMKPSTKATPKHPASVSHPPLNGHPEITSRLTEFFVPLQLVKDKKYVVALDGAAQGSKWWYDAAHQTLFVEQPDPASIPEGAKYRVIFGLAPVAAAKWPMKTIWEDFAPYYVPVLAAIIAILVYFFI